MPHHVYILYSTSRNLFYVGNTNNLKKRLLQHNNKASGFTAFGVPWTLLWASNKNSKSEAEALEKKLKNLTQLRKIRFINKYKDGIYDMALWEKIVDKLF